jgi:anhydro-N-acetylmuramic acid kinase
MPTEIIIGGGGGKNKTLMTMMASLLSPARLVRHEDIGLDSDFKEALVFAALAHETWYARPSTRSELTGASHPTVLGQITPGDNFLRLIQSTWNVQ